jgi:hypothetical protein
MFITAVVVIGLVLVDWCKAWMMDGMYMDSIVFQGVSILGRLIESFL